MKIKSIKVSKLFDCYSYSYDFEEDNQLSIILGINGMGKTTLLKLLYALLIGSKAKTNKQNNENLNLIRDTIFEYFEVSFQDNSKIVVRKNESNTISFTYYSDNKTNVLEILPLEKEKEKMAQHYHYVSRIIDKETKTSVLFIGANRIADDSIVAMLDSGKKRDASLSKVLKLAPKEYKVSKEQAKGLELLYLKVVGQRDMDFAEEFTTNLIRFRYKLYDDYKKTDDRIVQKCLWEELDACGFAPDAFKKMNVDVVEYSVDNLINNDLKKIIDYSHKFYEFKRFFEEFNFDGNPGNKTVIYENSKIYVKTLNSKIQFSQLSSGEKNLAYIFYSLIFGAGENSIILLDEPEISLHIAWQMKISNVLCDILREKPKMQIIIASHSPYISSGNDDLLVEPILF